jgi:hypothetical protein
MHWPATKRGQAIDVTPSKDLCFSLEVEAQALSLAEMPSGANAFEISDIQQDENKAALTRRSECNNVILGLKTAEWSFR